MATYARGVDVSGLPNYGLVQRFTVSYEGEFENAADENGNVVIEEGFNKKKNVEMEVKYDTTQTLPAIGSNITVNSEVYLVDSVSDAQDNKGYRTVTVSAHRWENNDFPST